MKPPETLDGIAKAVAKMKTDKLAERDGLVTQRDELTASITAIDSEIERLTMIEGAANGTVQLAPSPPPKAKAASTGNRAPRGSVQTDIARMLADKPDGLSRAEFLVVMQTGGDKKKKDASVSNALAAMKKAEKLAYNDGKYSLPASNKLI